MAVGAWYLRLHDPGFTPPVGLPAVTSRMWKRRRESGLTPSEQGGRGNER